MGNYQQFELLKKSAVTKIADDLDQKTAERLKSWENTRNYDTVYSFDDGFTIAEDERQKVALFDGEWYRWDGELPKIVSAGSTPAGTGGVDKGAWRSVGDAAARQDLANPMGAAMVGYGNGTVADKLNEIVSGAVTEPIVDAKIGTHNQDVNAHPELDTRFDSKVDAHNHAANSHPELRTSIVSEVSSHVTAEADRAETARDSAFVNADVYPDVATGRAAVADGEQFQVVVGDEIVRYRRDSASTQTEVARYPSSMSVKSSARIGVMVTTVAESINFDFNLNLFEVAPSTTRLYYGAGSLVLPEVSLDISTSDAGRPTRIAFDTVTQAYSVLGHNQVLTPSMVVICYFIRSTQEVHGVPVYSINGQSVTKLKVVARGSLVGRAELINLDMVGGHLQVSAGVRVLVPELSLSQLVSAQNVALPSALGTHCLCYIGSGNLEFIPASQSPDSDAAILGYYISGGSYLYGVDHYYVNGEPSHGEPSHVEEPYTTGTLIFEEENVNLNLTQGSLDIANAAVRLVIPGKPSPGVLPGQSVPLPTAAGSYGLYCLPDMSLTFASARVEGPPGAVLIGYYVVAAKRIFGLDHYYINGEPQAPGKGSIVTAPLVVAAGNFTPDYDQPNLPDYSAMQAAAAGDFNNIYALYDGLEASNTEYITSSVLGVDGLGNEIKQWEFIPLSGTLDGTKREFGRRPKIVLFSGIHGEEQAGIFNLYFTMKEICERWIDDSRLEALRFGVNFIIIPVANPSGFNASTRKNHNGVDIARNFPSGWILRDPTDKTYGGAAPMDQAETVILDSVMSEHRDAVYLGSHHNFVNNPAREVFIWNASATDFGVELGNALISIESIKVAKRYPSLPQNSNAYLGYSDREAPSGSEGYHAARAYGINAGTFEISRNWDWGVGAPPYSTEVATIGVETLINWILMNADKGTDIANAKIRI